MYDRIMIPLDGSPHAEAALAIATFIPSRLAYLLRVEQEASRMEHYISPSGQETNKRIVFRAGDDYLRRAGDAFRSSGREVEELQSWGDPADRIMEAAADVDLIVMATRGRGPAGRILHGSVADRVAREASAPVLLVPGVDRRPSPPITRVLVPLDGSDRAETALSAATALASDLGLPIHVVCVVDAPMTGGTPAASEPLYERARRVSAFAEHAARIYLADCIRRQGDDVAATCEVRSGAIVTELKAAIGPSDLVVMTTRGHRGLRRLVHGSVAEGLVGHAGAPVLLLRAGLATCSDDFDR